MLLSFIARSTFSIDMSASSEPSAFGEVGQTETAALLVPLRPYGNLTSIIYPSTCRVITNTYILMFH